MKAHDDKKLRISILNRRSFLLTAGSAVFLPPFAAFAEESPALALERSPKYEEAYAALTAGGTPLPDLVEIELPEIAENGNFVPLTVTVKSPMTPEDHVTTIHILSTANPVARIATFHLSPVNGAAKVQSRIRLAKTQEVMALAKLSNGLIALGSATVKVTIGGCSS